MLIYHLRQRLLLLQDLQAMLVLSHLLIHFPLLDIFLSDLARIIMWLLNNPLNDRVLHLSMSFRLLLVPWLSRQRGTSLQILDIGMVLHHYIQLIFLEQVQQILHKVHTVKQPQTLRQADPKVVVPLYLLLHEGLVILNALIIILSLRLLRRKGSILVVGHSTRHDQLFDILFMYLDAIHPHAAFLGKGLLDVNQTTLSLLDEMVHHFGYLDLSMRIRLALLLLFLRGDLMDYRVSLLVT